VLKFFSSILLLTLNNVRQLALCPSRYGRVTLLLRIERNKDLQVIMI